MHRTAVVSAGTQLVTVDGGGGEAGRIFTRLLLDEISLSVSYSFQGPACETWQPLDASAAVLMRRHTFMHVHKESQLTLSSKTRDIKYPTTKVKVKVSN